MKYWTNKELERLEEVRKMPGCWRLHLSEFPGRTINSLRHEANKHGWKKLHTYPGRPPTSQIKILALLDKGDMCRSEIAAELGIRECTVSEILQRLRLAGKICIKERLEGRGATMVWTIAKQPETEARHKPVINTREKRVARPAKPKKLQVERQPTVVHIRRDPFIEAMYGSAA